MQVHNQTLALAKPGRTRRGSVDTCCRSTAPAHRTMHQLLVAPIVTPAAGDRSQPAAMWASYLASCMWRQHDLWVSMLVMHHHHAHPPWQSWCSHCEKAHLLVAQEGLCEDAEPRGRVGIAGTASLHSSPVGCFDVLQLLRARTCGPARASTPALTQLLGMWRSSQQGHEPRGAGGPQRCSNIRRGRACLQALQPRGQALCQGQGPAAAAMGSLWG